MGGVMLPSLYDALLDYIKFLMNLDAEKNAQYAEEHLDTYSDPSSSEE
jgi:hypothetical protein